MIFIWRLLWVMLTSRFSSKLDFMDESTIYFRTLPTDIDVFMHMNNSRYFVFGDAARYDLMIRSNSLPFLKKAKVYPVVASEMIRFKKSIQLFERFKMTTKIIGWDDKFFYLTHHFRTRNKLCALIVVKACFLHDNSTLSPEEVLNIVHKQQPSPPLPDWIQSWQQADKQFYNDTLAKP